MSGSGEARGRTAGGGRPPSGPRTNVKHGATHQFGERGRTIRAKTRKGLRFQVGGRWVTKKQVKVSIPARPFLGLSEEDMEEIKATVEDFIEGSE